MQPYFLFFQSFEFLRSDRADMGDLREQKAGNNGPGQNFEHIKQNIFVGIGLVKMPPRIRRGYQPAKYLDCLFVSDQRINRFWKGTSVSPQLENKIDGPRFSLCFCRSDCFVCFNHDLG